MLGAVLLAEADCLLALGVEHDALQVVWVLEVQTPGARR
jgi:hypothetical protein